MTTLTVAPHERIDVEMDGNVCRVIHSFDDPEDPTPPRPDIVCLPANARVALAEALMQAEEDGWDGRQMELWR